jgi:SAM-dependent methyltransferase
MSAGVELESVPCDLCGRSEGTVLFVGRDYRFGRTEQYTFVRCESCGLIRLNPRPSMSALQELYELEYPIEMETSPERGIRKSELLRSLWHRLTGNYTDRVITRVRGRVLDVGCGYGKYLLPLKKKGCEVYGVEVNPKCVDFCRKAGLTVFRGTLEEANFPDAFVDFVILSQVLEHVPSPKRTLKEIHRVLKPSGRVLIYCPNGKGYLRDLFGMYWHGWHIPFHLYVFTAPTLTQLANEAGFAVARIRTVTPVDFLTTSLKSYFYGRKAGVRAVERGKAFDSLVFRALVSPLLRLADFLWKERGDCLDAELVKS